MPSYQATKPGQTLVGTDDTDYLGDVAGGDVLIGGGGDEFYYVNSRATQIFQLAGGGNDTVYAFCSFTTPDNIEYVILNGPVSPLTAFANAAGTNMTAVSSYATLMSGAGNDTMTDSSAGGVIFGFQSG